MRYINKCLLLSAVLLAGCSDFSEKKEKLLGERIAAYSVAPQTIADPSISNKVFSAPSVSPIATWSASQYPKEVVGHNLALQLNHIKQVRGFNLPISRHLSPTVPVVAKDAIYTVDHSGVVKAFNIKDGKLIWKNEGMNKDKALAGLLKGRKTFFGGMLYHEGKLFVTVGLKGIVALDGTSGKMLWYKELSAMVRGVPILIGDKVVVQAVNNNIFALKADNGELLWVYWGIKGSDIAPLDAPILARHGSVIISQQSGNSIHAIDINDGQHLWKVDFYGDYEEMTLSDVNSSYIKVVSYGDLIYALHPSGKLMAVNPRNDGALMWEQQVASCQNFWIAGNLIFVATEDSLVAIARNDGKVKWVSPIDVQVEKNKGYKQNKEKKATWFKQPIVAGGEVLLANSNGQIARFNYSDGKYLSTMETSLAPVIAPIIADGKLFILSKNGEIYQFAQR